jgi:hypothetical protein
MRLRNRQKTAGAQRIKYKGEIPFRGFVQAVLIHDKPKYGRNDHSDHRDSGTKRKQYGQEPWPQEVELLFD